MRRFKVYRPQAPEEYLASGTANPPDQVQFEGVVFSDGTAAVRWLTKYRSTSVWASLEELLAVHGHPEYETVFEWLDGEPGWIKDPGIIGSRQPDPAQVSVSWTGNPGMMHGYCNDPDCGPCNRFRQKP